MATSLGEKLTAATPILTLGLGLLALFAGVDNWWVIFVIGWAVVTPLMGILFDEDEADEEHGTTTEPARETQDALDTLRERYARGELSEEQFERKVERLLETETIEDARDRVARSGGEPVDEETVDTRPDRERDAERERER
jgi:uncharacterized membrane protein